MNYLPDAIQGNDDYLAIFKNNWKELKMVDYISLIDQVILIFERLAGEKNEMAKIASLNLHNIRLKTRELFFNGNQDEEINLQRAKILQIVFPKSDIRGGLTSL